MGDGGKACRVFTWRRDNREKRWGREGGRARNRRLRRRRRGRGKKRGGIRGRENGRGACQPSSILFSPFSAQRRGGGFLLPSPPPPLSHISDFFPDKINASRTVQRGMMGMRKMRNPAAALRSPSPSSSFPSPLTPTTPPLPWAVRDTLKEFLTRNLDRFQDGGNGGSTLASLLLFPLPSPPKKAEDKERTKEMSS